MKKFDDIEPPDDARTKYNFAQFNSGSSTHVSTARERRNILIAYKYWAKHTKEGKKRFGAYATSRKVGPDDPAGEGYRIWFLKREAAPKPAPQAPQATASNEDDI